MDKDEWITPTTQTIDELIEVQIVLLIPTIVLIHNLSPTSYYYAKKCYYNHY